MKGLPDRRCTDCAVPGSGGRTGGGCGGLEN